MAFIVLSLAILAAFWNWNAGPVYWLRGFSNTKLSFPTSFESQTEHWWQWASREGSDVHQNAALLPGQHLEPASEHGTDVFQVTTEGLRFTDPIGLLDRPCIDL